MSFVIIIMLFNSEFVQSNYEVYYIDDSFNCKSASKQPNLIQLGIEPFKSSMIIKSLMSNSSSGIRTNLKCSLTVSQNKSFLFLI